MKTILLIPTANNADEGLPVKIMKKLEREGYLPIFVKDPKSVRLLAVSELGIDGDMMTMAALEAICAGYETTQARFTKELFRRLKDRQNATQSAPVRAKKEQYERTCGTP